MDPAVLREDMVDALEAGEPGVVQSETVGLAMRAVPRRHFLTEGQHPHADTAYRIDGTTAYAPSTVARLLEALAPDAGHKVLIVGVGVGYTAALVAEIVEPVNVTAVDLAGRMVSRARQNLAAAGYDAVLVAQADGANGFPAYAPYDRILVEPAAVSPPRRLLEQLAPTGRLTMPRGAPDPELVAVEDDEVVARFGAMAAPPMLVPGEEAGAIERNRTRREDREFAERAAQRRSGWERDWIDWEDQEAHRR